MKKAVHAGAILGFLTLFAQPSAAIAESLLERGTYLMQGIVACGNCHTPVGPKGPIGGMELAGGFKIEEEPFTAFASNITPDEETGIGKWSDEEIITAIREGLRPDGSLIGPPMPIELYRGLSDRDAKAIVAYLRSVKPVANKVEKSVYRMPLPKAYGPPVGQVGEVSRDDEIAYGAYLAGAAGHCIECHTPLVKGRRDFTTQLGRGGQKWEGPWGVSVARNITPHVEAGLGEWSDEEIRKVITTGIARNGEPRFPPMPYGYYRNINDADLGAITAYLRSLKPLE